MSTCNAKWAVSGVIGYIGGVIITVSNWCCCDQLVCKEICLFVNPARSFFLFVRSFVRGYNVSRLIYSLMCLYSSHAFYVFLLYKCFNDIFIDCLFVCLGDLF